MIQSMVGSVSQNSKRNVNFTASYGETKEVGKELVKFLNDIKAPYPTETLTSTLNKINMGDVKDLVLKRISEFLSPERKNVFQSAEDYDNIILNDEESKELHNKFDEIMGALYQIFSDKKVDFIGQKMGIFKDKNIIGGLIEKSGIFAEDGVMAKIFGKDMKKVSAEDLAAKKAQYSAELVKFQDFKKGIVDSF